MAQAKGALGDKSLEEGLLRKIAVRSKAELTGTGVPGIVFQTEAGPGIELPASWRMQESERGHYHVASIRPEMPDVKVDCEVGRFDSYRANTPIDWRGTEKELKLKYGSNYRRVRLIDTATLSGLPASLWEYELRKPDGPPLHKVCVGRRTAWSSCVVICMAPEQEFKIWAPFFRKAVASFGD